jgi:hypothetical protein
MKVNNLRDKLLNQIDKLESGQIPLDTAREISRTAQSVIESIRVEIIYSKSISSKKKIDFMEY